MFGGPKGYLAKYRIGVTPNLLAFMVTLLYWILVSGSGRLNSDACSAKYAEYLALYNNLSLEAWTEVVDFYKPESQTLVLPSFDEEPDYFPPDEP